MCGCVVCDVWCGVVGSVWYIMCDVSCYILYIAVSGVSNKVKQGKEVRGRNGEERENGWS